MEVCEIIKGQQAFPRLTDKQQKAEMTRNTVMNPHDRFRKIDETVSLCNFLEFYIFRVYIALCHRKLAKVNLTYLKHNYLCHKNILHCSFPSAARENIGEIRRGID